MFSPLLLAALAAPLVRAATFEYFWNITWVDGANPSGLFPRQVIGVNGTWPPPPITVTQNDTLIIHAYNGLGNVGTSLHSHGIFFNGSSYFDGAVGVTQCAIPPGETLTYNIPTDLQSGTYWIHGHYDGQYVDGLRTPFVIKPLVHEPYTWDGDYTVVVADWYNQLHKPLKDYFLNIYNPTGAEPVPTAPTLYVLPNNTWADDCANGSCVFDGSAVGNNATIKFEKGKTYRIRFINMSALAMFFLGIDGHDIKVIELDGVISEPYPATIVPLSVAQRVSFLVTARNDTEADQHDWPIIANMNPDMFDTIPDSLQMNITARISYTDSPLDLPEATIYDPYPDFEDIDLVPVEVEALAPADFQQRLDAYFDTYDDGTNRASFNNITYQSPKVPSIITALTMPAEDSFLTANAGESNASFSKIYGVQTQAIALEYMNNIEVTIYNWDAGLHPFHLHGHKFQLVQKSYDASTGVPVNESQPNPMRRDTVMVPPGGSTTIRWRADNPGVWFLHCHIDWHLESGLAAVFLEAPAQMQAKLSFPQQMADHCKALNIPTSGNVVGLNSTTDFKGQPVGPFTQWHLIGWTPKAKGALAGCVLAALVGILTIVWYSFHALDEEETRLVQQRKFEHKLAEKAAGRGGKIGAVKGLFAKKQ